MRSYDHKKIEKKWQKEWEKSGIYNTPDSKKNADNFYLLTEFAYPSGNLHVGHWYAFSVPDIFARFLRMNGKNVLYPAGFDAFGLPAENAAIKNKKNPRVWTEENIDYMRKQEKSMGATFDWSREVITCDPKYYKWTQWMFAQMFKRGLAYQKETAVNWCPKDKTVLANEQVVDGRCERCDSEVEQKKMLQWNLKITDYADRLIKDLDGLDWPEQIKESQKNWIGKSEGAMIKFQIANSKLQIEVFTTRPDTLFGATYMVLAPEHPLVEKLSGHISNWSDVSKYVKAAAKKSEIERTTESKEKTGVELKGVKAINPANKKEIPVFVADYVLGHYGTGAIMAVPAHDERDFAFAKKFDLPIVQVIEPVLVQTTGSAKFREHEQVQDSHGVIALVKHWKEEKYIGLYWPSAEWGTLLTGGIDDGFTPEETVLKEIREETGFVNAEIIESLGVIHSKYYHAPKQLNRFGHAPTFIVQLKDGAKEEVSEEELARHELRWLTKEELKNFLTATSHLQAVAYLDSRVYTGLGLLVNSDTFNEMNNEEAKKKITEAVGGKMTSTYKLRDWVVSRQRYWGVPIPIIHCEKCGPVPVPDKDFPVLLPEIKDYLPRDDGKSPLSKAEKWVKTKCPKCKGTAERETDTLDTFVDSSWYFLRYTDPENKKEFASKKKMQNWMPVDLYSGGSEHTTMHVLYSRFWHKVLFDMGYVAEPEPYKRRMNRGLIMGPDGQKMSKSRGNVIDPDKEVERFGADTVRMYLAFIGPYAEAGSYPWNPDGVVGVRRFLERVRRLSEKVGKVDEKTEKFVHKTIKKVSDDIPLLKFNTAIAAMMTLINIVEKTGISKKEYELLLKILAPFAPHLTEELWRELGHKKSIHIEKWPEANANLLVDTIVKMVVQINGKVRAEFEVESGAEKGAIEKAARSAVEERLTGVEVIKVIVVPNRLVNFVTKS